MGRYYNLGPRAPRLKWSAGGGAVPIGAVGSSSIAAGSITDVHVSASALLDGAKFKLASVAGDKIPNRAIGGLHVILGSLDTTHLSPAAGLLGSQFANRTIAAINIGNGVITENEISPRTITQASLSASAGITGGQVATGTLTESNIVAGTLTHASIAAGTIRESEIASQTLTGASMSANSVGGDKLRDGSVTKTQIGSRQISNKHFRAGTLTADRVASTNTQPLADNLLLYSEQFDNTAWVKAGVGGNNPTVTADATTAPDGTTSADAIAFPLGADGNSFAYQDLIGLAAGMTYTFSVWLWTNLGTKSIRLTRTDGSTWSTATVSPTITVTTTPTRYSLTFVQSGSTSDLVIGGEGKTPFSPSSGTIYAWGAQMEMAVEAGPYVKTTTTAKTDAASTYPTVTGLTESHIASINGSVASITNMDAAQLTRGTLDAANRIAAGAITNSHLAASGLDAGKFTTGSLALARLAAGALPTGVSAVTIADGNVATGAAIGLAKLATGALPSGITVADANFSGTLLASKVATGLLAAQITSVNPSALTGSGTIPAAAIGAASITGGKLENFIRSGFLYKLAADTAVINSNTAITFATQVYDALNQRSGANFIPNATGIWQWSVRLRLEGGDIAPGYGVSVVLLDVTAGTVLYTSPVENVFSDASGTSTSDVPVDTCIAKLDRAISVVAGNSYAIGFLFVKLVHFNIASSTWAATLGQAIAKADYANSHVATINVAGSYVQVTPVIQ